MRKLAFFASVLSIILAFFFANTIFTPISAQVNDTSRSKRDVEGDRAMAAEISQLTSRDQENLLIERGPFGIRADLRGGFQSLALARMGEDGHIDGYCVNSLDEANAFFGRDLNTGDPVPRTQMPDRDFARIAADHGMSVDEFRFYSSMIDQFQYETSLSPSSATLTIVNNNAAGVGFNDPAAAFANPEGGNTGATRGQQRLNVFNQAAIIWGSFLDSSVPINIQAAMINQTCSTSGAVLGSAGATTIHGNFANAPFTNTWYNQALANKISGSDLSAVNPDINANFNLDIDTGCLAANSRWYYGFDNATPSLRINLLVVLLHEMGHGLGFQTFANGSTGALNGGFPDQWSRMMFDNTTGLHWDAMSNAQRQTSAVSNGALRWDGASVVLSATTYLSAGKDAQNRPELYAPAVFSGGSSVSHYSTLATPNVLMEPAINTGLPIDLDLTRQLMRDIGWYRDTTADLVPDTITNVVPATGQAGIGSNKTVTWTNTGGFNRNVTIELSTDGGVTFPTTLASNIANTGSFVWTVPNNQTAQARIRVREHNFAAPIGTSANFVIAVVTAAPVSVAGRVMDAAGRAVSGAVITLSGQSGDVRRAVTNAFGYFRIDDIASGATYTISAGHKRYNFATQVIDLTDSITNYEIVAQQ